MANSKRRLVWVIVLILLFGSGISGGYFYFSKMFQQHPPQREEVAEKGIGQMEDLFSLRMYYPVDGRLQMEERMLQRRTTQMSIAEAVIGEFLRGPAGAKASVIPRDARLLGLYRGADGMLYVDLSDEFRRNFQGDVVAEFLLLKGLYESLISNVQEITDVKVLIEGREIESLGGHIYLIYPLKDVVSQESLGTDKSGT